jgi:anti-sigma B factor antagonist
MELAVEGVDGVVVVIIPVAELDAANTAEFKRDIARVLEAHSRVILDLTRLRFIDSSGLGAIISCLRKLNEKQGDLKLCGMSRQVRTAFELVRMHRIIDIHGTREEAIHGFQARMP